MAKPSDGSPRIVPFPGAPDQGAPATLPTLPTLEEIARADAAADADEEALPQLVVIGAAAEADGNTDKAVEDDAKRPTRSARERLTSRTREAKPRKKRAGLIAGIVIIILLLAIAGAAVGGFAWLRWYAHDDAADFQGTWYVSGSAASIEIGPDTIRLTDKVSYRYVLNTQDKTIEFSIGDMTGYGSYRFSLDRSQLVIFDGRMEADAVLSADIRWLLGALIDEVTDERNDLTAGIRRNLTLLTREPLAEGDLLDVGSDIPSDGEGSSSGDATTGDSAEPVWSAEQWLNRGSSSSSTSDTDDMGLLLDDLNDLPIDDALTPETAG